MLSAVQVAVLALSLTLTSAVDVTFFSSEQCGSGALYGGRVISTVPCYRLDKHLDITPGNSTAIENIIAGQTVLFYSDAKCTQEVYSTTADLCYTHPETTVAAFKVVQSAEGTTALATTEPQNNFAMTNYYGLVPASPELSSSTIILGALVAIGVSKASDIVTLASGCLTAAGNPLGIASCALGIASTIVVLVSGYVIHRETTRERARFQATMGNQVNIKKRDLIEGVNAVNEDYMQTLMNSTTAPHRGVHVGYHDRNIGNGLMQTSPVWQVDHNGTLHHVTAFYNHEADEFVHTLLFPDTSANEKRQDTSYNDERWKAGGFDFKTCEYNTDADTSTISNDIPTLYSEVDQDLECLIDPDSVGNGDGFAVSIMNGANVMLAQVFMTTYDAAGDATSIDGYGTCGQITSTPVEQTCQY